MKPDDAGAITLPEHATVDAPAGADRLRVAVARVEVEGGAPAFADTIAKATAGLAGHMVRVSDLYLAAAQIEAAYARAGYVLTRVTLPPQRIVDGGNVKFLIVDGFIEDVSLDGVPAHVQGVVRRRVAGLVGARGLTLAQIERRVLLAGDIPGVQLKTTLVRGGAVGATRLILEADYRPVTGSLGFENDLGYAYEYEALSTQVAFNSLLGLGEQIYAQATTGPDIENLLSANTRRRVLGAGAILPIGDDGLTINPEYTAVQTNPRLPQGAAQVTGQFRRFSVRASYPVIKTRRQSLGISSSFDLTTETETVRAFGLTLSRDRLRIASVGVNWSRSILASTTLATDLLYMHGLTGLGARSQADAAASGIPVSRQGSQPDFSKVVGHWRSDTQLGGGFDLTAIARGQASLSGALPASAQFSLDGEDSLSSFAQGSLNADSGATGRVELGRTIAYGRENRGLITPYAFGAVGHGHLSDPTVLERRNIDSWAWGGGLRVLVVPYGTGLTGFASVEISHGHATTLAQDPTRVLVSYTIRR